VFTSLLTQRQFSERNFAIGTLNHPAPLNNYQSRLMVQQVLLPSFKNCGLRNQQSLALPNGEGSMPEHAGPNAAGMPLDQAVIDAGAVRFRPMMLTAAAVIAGSAIILFDPIFQGLAIALMAGEIASLALSRMTVPVVYYQVNKNRSRYDLLN